MYKYLFSILLSFFCCSLFSQTEYALVTKPTTIYVPAITDAFTADIIRLIEITEDRDFYEQTIRDLIASIKGMENNMEPVFWQKLERDMTEVAYEEMKNVMVRVYKRHLNHEEIKTLVAFYETPAGRKYLDKMPLISRDAQIATRIWGDELGRQIYEQVRKEIEEENNK